VRIRERQVFGQLFFSVFCYFCLFFLRKIEFEIIGARMKACFIQLLDEKAILSYERRKAQYLLIGF